MVPRGTKLVAAIAVGMIAILAVSTATAEAEPNPPTRSDVEAPAATPTPTNETLSQMIRRVRPAVVGVSEGLNVVGTGFIFRTVDEDPDDDDPDEGAAYIMTNFHVIEEISDLRVLVEDTAYRRATLVATDPRRDLAMLRICCSSEWTAVEFKDTDDMYPGDEVIAIGYALGTEMIVPHKFKVGRDIVHGAATVTRGIISAFRYGQQMDAQLLQHDAPINGGNSGGPLLSRDGRVVGVNTLSLVALDIEGLHFAVLETTVQERIRLWDLGPSASFGPLTGSMAHDTDNSMESFTSEFQATGDEFAIRATFTNPYSAEQNLWSYGFMFGDGEGTDDVSFLVVDSLGEWVVETYRDGEFHTIHEGLAPQLLTGEGQKNELELWVDGPYAWVLVNGQRVMEVLDDLEFPVDSIDMGPGSSHEGEVSVITGYWVGSEQRGSVTQYEDFAGLTYDHSR